MGKDKKCPSGKIKSQGKGKGLGMGKSKGPVGKPNKRSVLAETLRKFKSK